MLDRILLVLFLFVAFAVADGDVITTSLPVFKEANTPIQRSGISQDQVYLENAIDSTYKVGPGDYFEILTTKGLDVVQISPEGSVSIPECGMVSVSNMTLAEAKTEIIKLLKKKYDEKFTRVQIVRLRQLQISALGAITIPGRRFADPQTRLSNAIAIFGGLLPSADRKNIMVYRGTDTLRIDFSAFENEGNDSMNISLETGDIIYIPFSRAEESITLLTPTSRLSMPCLSKKTLGEYITEAKLDPQLNLRWVKLKKPDGSVLTYDLNEAWDLALAPKTEVELWNKEPYVYVGGAVAKMGKAPYNPEFHAIDYIAASGVTIMTGSWNRVTVIRDGEHFSVNPYKDEIKVGDYIEIPRSVYESVKDITLFLASLLSVVATAIIIISY